LKVAKYFSKLSKYFFKVSKLKRIGKEIEELREGNRKTQGEKLNAAGEEGSTHSTANLKIQRKLRM